MPPDSTRYKNVDPNKKLKRTFFEQDGSILFVCVLSMPIFLLSINALCNKQQCSLTELPDMSKYTNWDSWFTRRAFLVILCHIIITALSFYVPLFGEKITIKEKNVSFTANAVYVPFTTISIIIVFKIFDIDVFDIIREDYFQIGLASLIFGSLLAILLYIKGRKMPKVAKHLNTKQKDHLQQFILGIKQNPILFNNFHVKYFIFRYALIGSVIVNVMCIYCSVMKYNISDIYNTIVGNLTLDLFCIGMIIYIYSFLCYEAEQLFTFEFTDESVGYFMCAGYFFYPFFTSAIPKYVLDQNIQLPMYEFIFATVLILVGLYIMHRSNFEKNLFRQNPLDHRVSHFNTIETSQGKKLLAGGWWGFVRHPNYLGDLLFQFAMAIPIYNTPLVGIIVMTYFVLIDRSQKVKNRCKMQYGRDWDSYCDKVPYSLIPGVY